MTLNWFSLIWFGLVLWHINHCGLFNAKSGLFIYQIYVICNTLPDTSNINKQKQPIQNEPTSKNGNPTQPNTTQQNNLELTQEQKLILKKFKRILNKEKTTLPSLRNIEWRIVKVETNKVNQVLTYISTNNITELNELIYAGAKLVCEKIGIPLKNTKEKSKPGGEFWLETQIENLRKQLKVIKQKKNAEINRNRKERTTQEKLTLQLEGIYQKVLAKEGRLKRYRQRVKPYRQNRTFQNNERKFYQQLGGDDNKTYQQPDAVETERFWTKIWQPKQHNEKAEWINHIKRELEELEEGPKAEMHTELLKTTFKKVSNWKTPGHEGIHGFWFKKFTSIHDRLALEMNKCLQTAHVPEWMTKIRTSLIQKDPNKGTALNNYRPIICLPMMWKILTAQIREEIYHSLTSRGLFPDEQKGCCKGSRGTAELLYIDQHILNESKTTRKNQAMAWIDYKKAYMFPHSWIINSLKMYKISQEVIHFIDKNYENQESWIDNRRKKISWSKDPKRDFLRRCSITLTIHNCHDATKPHTQKMHSRIQTQ